MIFSQCRARARYLRRIAALLAVVATSSNPAIAASGLPPLTLDDAVRIALASQPALTAASARGRALREDAVAERQLPDPELVAGIMQMPVGGADSFSLRGDDFTAVSVGVSQELPGSAKRKLRAARTGLEARAVESGAAATAIRLRRDVGRAWLEAWAAAAATRLSEDLGREEGRRRDAAVIEATAGELARADVLAAGVAAELAADRTRAARQKELATRAVLERWIGPAAGRPLPESAPRFPDAPALEALLDRLPEHPSLVGTGNLVQVAATELRLAEAGRKPDWRVELRYDHRLEFDDLVTVMVGVDLPVFPGDRQDRRAAAARERLAAYRADVEDARREANAALVTAWNGWEAGVTRLDRYDTTLLPAARDRVSAALAAYESGAGSLTLVLDARRSLLEVELMRLDLQASALRDRLEIEYFTAGVVP